MESEAEKRKAHGAIEVAAADGADRRADGGGLFCPRCLTANSVGDLYCTSCGQRLPAAISPGAGTAAADAAVGGAAEGGAHEVPLASALPRTADPAGASSTPSRQRRWPLVAVIVVAVALVATLAALWQVQRRHAAHLSSWLSATQTQLAATEKSLSQTREKLAATSSLSEKRRSVLLRTQDVLAKVDLLLSSVDGVQARAGNLQSEGDTLSSHAEALIQTTVTLVNYLVATDTSAVDYGYVNGLIDTANADLRSVRADEYQFGAYDNAYSKASTAFVHRADRFSTAVRALQKQLKQVAAP